MMISENADSSTYAVDFYDHLFKMYMKRDKNFPELYRRMVESGHFASSTKTAEENIADKMNSRLKNMEGVHSKDELSQTFTPPENGKAVWYDEKQHKQHIQDTAHRNSVIDTALGMLDQVPGYSKADAETKQRVSDNVAKYTNVDGSSVGLSDTDIALWNAALAMADEPTASGNYGSYKNDEVDKAVRSMGYTNAQAAFLFDLLKPDAKNNPYRK